MASPQPTTSRLGPAIADETSGLGIGWTVTVGLVVIAAFFGGLGRWATVSTLESAAIAPGVVSVASNRKTVQHLEGGIIGKILVRDGDEVTAGQVLFRLDDTQPRATLDLMRGRQRAAAALEARLVAERDGHDEITFPDWLLTDRDDPKVAAVIDGETSIFDARRVTLASQIAVLGQRVAQVDEEIIGLGGQIAAEDVQLLLIAEEKHAVLVLVEKGLERKPRLLALQRRESEIVGSRSGNVAQIARVKQNIGEAHLRISELDTARINEVGEQLRAAQNELFDLAERIHAAEDILRRTAILAIQDGTVVNLQVHTPGGVIAPGAPLLDIVPSDDALIIEARVDPRDIDVVHWGLPARVHLTAFNQRSATPMNGRVLSVSADNIIDERTGQAYYLARIKLDKDPAEAGNGVSLYPGMQAEVMIVSGARTVLDYLLAPWTARCARIEAMTVSIVAELDALSQRQFVGVVDGVGGAPHVGLPGVGAGFAAAAGVLLAAESTADLGP